MSTNKTSCENGELPVGRSRDGRGSRETTSHPDQVGGEQMNRKRLVLIGLVGALLLLLVYTSVSYVLFQGQIATLRASKITLSWRSTTEQQESVNAGQCGKYDNNFVFTASNCVYTITGAYANTGQVATTNTTFTFNFWPIQGSNIGQLVCRKELSVGSVAGASLLLLPQPLTCQSSSSIYGAYINATWT